MPHSGQLTQTAAIPFDTDLLDRLMDKAGIDVLLAKSKHNVQYLLGGHRSIFFDYMDAIGMSRYLPVFIYPKGAPDRAGYIGYRLEQYQTRSQAVLGSGAQTTTSGCVDAMEKAMDYVRALGIEAAPHRCREPVPAGSTPPWRFARRLSRKRPRQGCARRCWNGCARARRPAELELLREASERVINSMLAVITKPWSRHHQAGDGRCAAAGGDEPRHDVRILLDHRRHERQPRAIGAEMATGRYPVAQLRRQLPRLYRRRVPHGDPRRAGRGTGGDPGRDRRNPARGVQPIKPGAMGGDIYAAARAAARRVAAITSIWTFSLTAWVW